MSGFTDGRPLLVFGPGEAAGDLAVVFLAAAFALAAAATFPPDDGRTGVPFGRPAFGDAAGAAPPIAPSILSTAAEAAASMAAVAMAAGSFSPSDSESLAGLSSGSGSASFSAFLSRSALFCFSLFDFDFDFDLCFFDFLLCLGRGLGEESELGGC